MLEYVPNARMVAKACAQIQPGQEILILADNALREIAYGEVLRDVINEMGAEAVLMIITKRKARVHEPPRSAAAAMVNADAVIRVTTMAMGHTDARMAATAKGIKYYNLINVPEEVFAAPYPLEWVEEIVHRTDTLARMLTEGNLVKVTSPMGTNVTISIKGRDGMSLHAHSKGIANLLLAGGGEALVSPVEDGANGVIVVDVRTNPTSGTLAMPVTWKVEKGRVVEITGGTPEENARQRKLMSLDEGANVVAEFAFNTGRPASKIIESEEGMVHIAFGRSDDLGGVNFSKNHLDGFIRNPTVEIDGVRVVEAGRILVD